MFATRFGILIARLTVQPLSRGKDCAYSWRRSPRDGPLLRSGNEHRKLFLSSRIIMLK